MSAGYQNLFLERGTTWNTTLTLDDPYGEPYDLNGFEVKSQAKKSYYSANATITFISTILDASNGVIQLKADANTTCNIKPGNLVYDVLLTEPVFLSKSRVLEGIIYVSPSVTN